MANEQPTSVKDGELHRPAILSEDGSISTRVGLSSDQSKRFKSSEEAEAFAMRHLERRALLLSRIKNPRNFVIGAITSAIIGAFILGGYKAVWIWLFYTPQLAWQATPAHSAREKIVDFYYEEFGLRLSIDDLRGFNFSLPEIPREKYIAEISPYWMSIQADCDSLEYIGNRMNNFLKLTNRSHDEFASRIYSKWILHSYCNSGRTYYTLGANRQRIDQDTLYSPNL